MAMQYPNPYQNGYPNTYQQYSSPTWLPQQNQMPQPNLPIQETNPNPQAIFGKVVSSADDIAANDVPMNGKIALFPLSDYTKIIGKQWTKDGTIATVTYVPEMHQQQTKSAITLEDISKQFNERMDQLEDMLTTPNKKESDKNA